jgi:predicted aconitase with swiveling domain
MMELKGEILCQGSAKGEVLILDESLSFWGGVNLATGQIVDMHHPQVGKIISGKIVFLPGTKGSTAGPGALLELIYSGMAPVGIILTLEDSVCLIAAEMAKSICNMKIPILRIRSLELPKNGSQVRIQEDQIVVEAVFG